MIIFLPSQQIVVNLENVYNDKLYNSPYSPYDVLRFHQL